MCDCGNKLETSTHNLRRNKTVSCGCVEKSKAIDRVVRTAYRHHLNNAEKRGYPSFLSKEEYLEVATKPCVYCGTLSNRANPDTGHQIGVNSVDRINNEPYYKVENVQPTCFICQRMKSDMKHSDFKAHIAKIILEST